MTGRVLAFKPAPTLNTEPFYVRMPDNSLSGVDIYQGDTLEVRRTDNFRPGDLVVVSVPPAARYVKHIYIEPDGRYRLEGAHPACSTRYYEPGEVRIEGVVM